MHLSNPVEPGTGKLKIERGAFAKSANLSENVETLAISFDFKAFNSLILVNLECELNIGTFAGNSF